MAWQTHRKINTGKNNSLILSLCDGGKKSYDLNSHDFNLAFKQSKTNATSRPTGNKKTGWLQRICQSQDPIKRASCQNSSKLLNNFFNYWGNNLKTVIFNCYLWTWPFTSFVFNIKLFLHFIILSHPARAHQNRSITFSVYYRKELKEILFKTIIQPPWPWILIKFS